MPRLMMPLLMLLVAACGRPEPRLSVDRVGVVASPGGAAAYFMIRNAGGPDLLESVEAPGSGSASIHETSMDGGVMRMRPLADGVELPSGGGAVFSPGGLHVMIMPASPLQPGGTIPLLFHFERHPDIRVDAPVTSRTGAMAH